jgi:hypothetical protein
VDVLVTVCLNAEDVWMELLDAQFWLLMSCFGYEINLKVVLVFS